MWDGRVLCAGTSWTVPWNLRGRMPPYSRELKEMQSFVQEEEKRAQDHVV